MIIHIFAALDIMFYLLFFYFTINNERDKAVCALFFAAVLYFVLMLMCTLGPVHYDPIDVFTFQRP